MKLNKILALAVAALTMTACSDDKVEDYPTFLGAVNTASDVTVSLPQTFEANENEEPFYLPVNVTGTPNGKIVVNVAVKELTSTPEGTEPAKEVEHYNVTAKTINIPGDEKTGYVEIYPVWVTGEINDDRVFEISITGAQGATVGNATCQVTIVNIDDPYTSMCGTWKLVGAKYSDGSAVSYNITMKTVSPSSEDYGSVLYGFGIFGESDYLLPFTDFEYDEVTGKGTMKLGVGEMMTDGLAFNYGDPVGVCFPVLLVRTASGLTMNADIVCTFDSNYNEIVIPEGTIIYGGLFSNSTLQYTGYTIGNMTDMTMTR